MFDTMHNQAIHMHNVANAWHMEVAERNARHVHGHAEHALEHVEYDEYREEIDASSISSKSNDFKNRFEAVKAYVNA